MYEVFKTYFFLADGEEVTIREKKGEGTTSTKSAVVAQIRKLKIDNLILKHQIREDHNLSQYFIVLEDGTLCLRLSHDDPYNVFLKGILNREKETEVVRVQIKEENARITSNVTEGERFGKTEDVLGLLRAMEHNGEVKSLTKAGDEKKEGSTISYTFETTENEKIRIYVDTANKEVIQALDAFQKETITKKPNFKRLALLTAGVALVVGTVMAAPKIAKMDFPIRETIEKTAYGDIEAEFSMVNSYMLRLTQGDLGVDEYFQLDSLVSTLIQYYEASGKTSSPDYQTLKGYQSTIDSHYQEYASKRGKVY